MGKQRRLTEPYFTTSRNHVGGDTGKITEQRFLTAQRQRDQRRTRFHHFQAELARQIIGEAGCPHFRDRWATGCHHQRRCLERAAIGHDPEQAIGMAYLSDRIATADRAAALGHFLQQHGDNLTRRPVTKQLAQCLFVPGNAV